MTFFMAMCLHTEHMLRKTALLSENISNGKKGHKKNGFKTVGHPTAGKM
jgi:hypothetical protein